MIDVVYLYVFGFHIAQTDLKFIEVPEANLNPLIHLFVPQVPECPVLAITKFCLVTVGAVLI